MADINIDPEDYWYSCSEYEREELAKTVVQEGYISDLLLEMIKKGRTSSFEPETYTEQEIVRLLMPFGIVKDLLSKSILTKYLKA